MVLGPISIVGSVLVGTAVLWAVRLSYGLRRTTSDDPARLVLTLAGWTLIHFGILSVAVQLFFVAPDARQEFGPWLARMTVGSIITVPIVMAVFGMAAARFRSLESSALLWLLCAAGERRVPLAEAVRSFALERSDEVGVRAARLADLLDSGVALPEALDGSHTRLPLEGMLAMRYGTETGDLTTAIRGLCGGTEEVDGLLRAAIEKGCYLGIVLWVGAGQVLFIDLQVLPILTRMYLEFGLELPAITAKVLSVAQSMESVAPFVAVIGSVGSLIFAVLGFLYYLDWLPSDFAFVGRMTRRYDSALVMRALAVAVGQGRPINRVVWMLSRLYPRRSIRRALEQAGTKMNDGEDWCKCLKTHRLITASDAAVFQAAQRVGNLQWALAEMADSSLRRLNYRLLVWLNVVFPLSLLLVAAIIAVTAIAFFLPLVGLMEGLA